MCDNIITIISSILSAIIGGYIGAWAGKRNIEKSYQLSCNEKIIRLKEQIQYLIELYKHNLKVYSESDRTQEDIDSAVWETDIFIFETEYKNYLLYTNLTEDEKRRILSWFHQWEIINKRMTQYLSEIHCSAIAAATILKEKCPKQNEQLECLLPDIESIVQKLNCKL